MARIKPPVYKKQQRVNNNHVNNPTKGESNVPVKVMEMVGESPDGWRSAVQSAIGEASKTAANIVGVEVVNFTANVENGRVVGYKANVKIAHN